MKLKWCSIVFLIFFTLKLQGHAGDHPMQPPTRVVRGTYYYYYSYNYSNNYYSNNYYYYYSYNNYYYYDDNYYSYDTYYDQDYNHTNTDTLIKRTTIIFVSALSACCFFVCAPFVGCICLLIVAMINSRNSRSGNSAHNAPPVAPAQPYISPYAYPEQPYISHLHNSPYAYLEQPVQTQVYAPLTNACYPGQPLPNNPMYPIDPAPPSYNAYQMETHQYIGFPE